MQGVILPSPPKDPGSKEWSGSEGGKKIPARFQEQQHMNGNEYNDLLAVINNAEASLSERLPKRFLEFVKGAMVPGGDKGRRNALLAR